MLKQLFSILLISSLIGPYLGISLYLKHEKRMLKREIKHRIIEGIDRSELVELSFTPEEKKQLRWEHSKEFEYNGEMYDVVESKSENGKITYWCWWDNEETKLNRRLNNLLARALHDTEPSNSTKNAQFWLNLVFLVPEISLKKNLEINMPQNKISYSDKYFSEITISGDSPPPEA
jgi:hypothetical protein